MTSLRQLETKLVELLDRKAPIKIPADGRKMLAGALWWIALLLGIVQLYTAITLWQWGHVADRFITTANYYTAVYVHHLGPFYYLSLLAMVVVALLMLLAAPGLKDMQKKGWDLLFYGLLIQAASSVFQLFADGGGLFDFFGAAVGTVIGAYLLFQVRDSFAVRHIAHHAASHNAVGSAVSKKHDAAADDIEEDN